MYRFTNSHEKPENLCQLTCHKIQFVNHELAKIITSFRTWVLNIYPPLSELVHPTSGVWTAMILTALGRVLYCIIKSGFIVIYIYMALPSGFSSRVPGNFLPSVQPMFLFIQGAFLTCFRRWILRYSLGTPIWDLTLWWVQTHPQRQAFKSHY